MIYVKKIEKSQLTITSFDKLYRKCFQEIVIDKNEYESLCKFFSLNWIMKIKMTFF